MMTSLHIASMGTYSLVPNKIQIETIFEKKRFIFVSTLVLLLCFYTNMEAFQRATLKFATLISSLTKNF